MSSSDKRRGAVTCLFWQKISCELLLQVYDIIMLSSLNIIVANFCLLLKGGSKVRVLRQGGACNSATNGPNNFKFCMQGAFVCYY